MNAQAGPRIALDEIKVNLRIRLATIWASFMFLYAYVDYFHLYMPGSIESLILGKVFLFEITQSFILAGLASVTIPGLMIFLSVSLPAGLSRSANLIVATAYVPYTLFNLAGEAWVHMVIGAVVEVILLLIIIVHAWSWPRIKIVACSQD